MPEIGHFLHPRYLVEEIQLILGLIDLLMGSFMFIQTKILLLQLILMGQDFSLLLLMSFLMMRGQLELVMLLQIGNQ